MPHLDMHSLKVSAAAVTFRHSVIDLDCTATFPCDFADEVNKDILSEAVRRAPSAAAPSWEPRTCRGLVGMGLEVLSDCPQAAGQHVGFAVHCVTPVAAQN
mmetsp:Transcript_11187/g.33542  ORF Transcript_11187/g.33542 Transcript_11187/m.33542 type:complete len:101 (+) Transcript_11187:1619-1921(+)|eukprot:CAMPEP_0206291834 /NCGR_PEP_ID=MMETSP0106_2-20121207/3320_1 /ASSEMBLY_ACC=CAM_ASM_000206 /TAXON_ID=81532 /ORGANISM="Acanthoeca-like sp., Strain 10tr" /LENGTH=100 /DNA_ID=CAMNT_0053722399 /DNA_START=1544 /DNA_END=1846 /DNA_ORIENTATION=+